MERAAGGVQAAKLESPSSSDPVPDRLQRQVRSVPAGRLLLIESASGYEAEQLVSVALKEHGDRVAWVRVDEFDEEPGRLWRHVAEALGMRPATHLSTVELLDHVLAACRHPVGAGNTWIVLERLDRALPGLPVGEIAYLAANLGEGAHLVVTSGRRLPDLHGRLSPDGVVRWTEHELRWDAREVEQVLPFLNEHGTAGGRLRDELVGLLGGWPAAARAVQEQGLSETRSAFEWLSSHGAEELLSAWWEGLTSDERTFLSDTQMLDVLDGSLCDAVCDRSDSADVLAGLVDRHRYVVSTPHVTGISYHQRLPLLSAFLRRRPLEPDVQRDRHRRAASWFAQHYDSDRQVRHLVLAGDADHALEVVHALENAMFEAGRADEVLNWYELFPADAPGGQVDALLRRAWGLLGSGDPHAARPLLGRLEGLALAPVTPAERRQNAEAALLAAALASAAGDPTALVAHADEAMHRFGDDWVGNGPQYACLLKARGLLWTGRVGDAAALLSEVTPRLESSSFITGLVAQHLAGAVALARGHVRVANARGESAVAYALREDLTGRSMEAAAGYLLRGLARTELGELDGAEQDLHTAFESARQFGNLGHAAFAGLGLSRVEVARHQPPAALAWITQVRRLLTAESPRSLLLRHVAAAEAHVRLNMGDVVRAERLIASLPPGSEATMLTIRLAQLRRPGSGLARLYDVPDSDVRWTIARQVLVAEALMPVSMRQTESVLLDIADVAAEEGLLLSMLGASGRLLNIAHDLALRRGHDALITLVSNAVPPSGAVSTDSRLVLSPGDVQLLALLPSRESNQEIADRLSVSINTVKTRLRRLYAKLGVSSRNDAVREARRRGLLQ